MSPEAQCSVAGSQSHLKKDRERLARDTEKKQGGQQRQHRTVQGRRQVDSTTKRISEESSDAELKS